MEPSSKRRVSVSRRGALAAAATFLLLAGCVSFRNMRAKNAYLKGDIDTAESLTDSALQSDPSNLEAKRLGAKIATRRGADALDRGDVAAARGYFQKAVNLYPADEVAEKYLDMLRREEATRVVK
jgi:tetratricopeptide (TPR) repeat protein